MFLKTILIFFILISDASAVPVLFKSRQSVLVRTGPNPHDVVAKPGIAQLLETVPGANSSAIANGKFPLEIGKAQLDIPVTKTYAAADLASAAADAILSKTAVGLVATLALPYVIDAATDAYMKQKPGNTTPATYDPNQYGICGYNGWQFYNMNASSCVAQANSFKQSINSTEVVTIGVCPGYAGAFLFEPGQNCNTAHWGGWSPYNGQPVRQNYCTSPSVYDSALNMCLGSAVLEPANAATLAADIAATMGTVPNFPKVVFDDLINHDIEPANGNEEVQQPSPSKVPGGSETTTKQYFDPATGHPVTEQTTKQTEYDVQKTGPKSLDVKPTVTSTTTITDNVTNNTTTVTSTTINNPSDADSQQPPETDCDKYPESIGCSKYGTAEPEAIPTAVLPLPAFNTGNNTASCPSPVSIHLPMYGNVEFPWSTVCQYAAMLRNVSVATALLGAAFFVLSALVVA